MFSLLLQDVKCFSEGSETMGVSTRDDNKDNELEVFVFNVYKTSKTNKSEIGSYDI